MNCTSNNEHVTLHTLLSYLQLLLMDRTQQSVVLSTHSEMIVTEITFLLLVFPGQTVQRSDHVAIEVFTFERLLTMMADLVFSYGNASSTQSNVSTTFMK